jgi:hypothetical protein
MGFVRRNDIATYIKRLLLTLSPFVRLLGYSGLLTDQRQVHLLLSRILLLIIDSDNRK